MKKSMIYYSVWYKKEKIGQTEEFLTENANKDEYIAARQKIIDDHAAANGLEPTDDNYNMTMMSNEPVMG
jgi:hypothetical protein